MVLKLDPRIPLVWRDPFSLQLGVTAPVVVLRDVSPTQERLIAALSTGTTRTGLDFVARACGADSAVVDALLRSVASVLEPERASAPPTVVVAGIGPTVQLLANDLAASGVRVRIADTADAAGSEPCDLAIVVGAFVIAPPYHALWLRRDIPHLPVVIGDTVVTVGPVVEPGAGPCLHCLNRYHVERDASWPAIATQLLGRRAEAESALVASEAAAVASRVATRRLRDGASSVHAELTVEIATGATTSTPRSAHPKCGCIELSASVPPENGSLDADRRDAATRPPTTGRVASARV